MNILPLAAFEPLSLRAGLLAMSLSLAACGGGGGGGGGGDPTPTPTPAPMLGDEARRAVLKDLGEDLIYPELQAFSQRAEALDVAVAAWAADVANSGLRGAAQSAWRDAMASWQRNEALQVGPAGLSSGLDATPGGEDLRDRIYAYPLRNECAVEQLAQQNVTVTAGSSIEVTGLGALAFLLFVDEVNPCGLGSPATPQQRAAYAASAADRVAVVAQTLRDRWDPEGGNFLSQWSNAGLSGSMMFYMRPQDALDALSVSLFYTEKETKDRKIACPTGIGATGLTCPASDVARVEFPRARFSTEAIRANVQAFRDAFSGVGGGLGINALLEGIERSDIADDLMVELDATLALIDTLDPDFEAEVAAISDSTACTNAASAASGEPTACALQGQIKRAMDLFRTDVVGALSLATPDRAAGDND